MVFKNWFKHLIHKQSGSELSGASTTEYSTTLTHEEAVGLNFKAAIEAHQHWKNRLMAVVDGRSSETLNVDMVSRDDQCLLGKWIHSIGEQHFSSLEQFRQLKKNHADFHTCAGHILHLAQTENKDQALAELKEGRYAFAYQDIAEDLISIYSQVTK